MPRAVLVIHADVTRRDRRATAESGYRPVALGKIIGRIGAEHGTIVHGGRVIVRPVVRAAPNRVDVAGGFAPIVTNVVGRVQCDEAAGIHALLLVREPESVPELVSELAAGR